MHNKSSKNGSERLMPTPTAGDAVGARNKTSGRSNPNSKHHSGTTLYDFVHPDYTTTSSPSTAPTTQASICSQGDFLVSLSVSPGSDSAREMTVRSGLKCSELYKRQGPLGSLVRMLLGSCRWNSTISYLTWKASATPRGRLLFRLVPSMPDIEETGFGLWRTPCATDGTNGGPNARDSAGGLHLSAQVHQVKMWPTPTVDEASNVTRTSGVFQSLTRSVQESVKMWPTPRAGKTTDETEEAWTLRRDAGKVSTPPLTLAVKMWPTPTANEDACGKSTGKMQAMLGNHPQLGKTSETGSLNPAWVEWLMGYPIGHTVCAGWVTPSSRRLLKKSSEQSPA